MSQDASSPPRAGSVASSVASCIHPSPTGSSSSDDESEEEFDSLYRQQMWELILGDSSEDELDTLFEDTLFRAAGATRAQLRQLAAAREEARAAKQALRREMAAHRKAMRDRTRALRQETKAVRDRTRRLSEYTDLLKADVSRYTDAQLAEHKRDLDRRSRELFGNGGGGGN